MYYKGKKSRYYDARIMETSTVCTHLTETPADQPRKLPNEQKSLAQFGIDIEVGKAVVSVPFEFYKLLVKKNIY